MAEHINNLLRLEIDALDALNLITNHSGTVNASGWIANTFGTSISAVTVNTDAGRTIEGPYGGRAVKLSYNTSGQNILQLPEVDITPGDWVGYQLDIAKYVGSGTARLWMTTLEFTGGPTVNEWFGDPVNITASDRTTTLSLVGQAGATATRVRALIIFEDTDVPVVANRWYSTKAMVVSAASEALVTDMTFYDSEPWQNILSSAYSVQTFTGLNQDGASDVLQVGTLHAVVTDPLLNPRSNPRMRPGRKIRLVGNGSTQWAGKISTLDVDYSGKVNTLIIQAVDAVADLGNVQVPEGWSGTLKQRVNKIMASVPDVAYTVTDTATPTTSALIDVQDSATALNQLEWAVRSMGGYMAIGRDGQLEVYASNSIPPDVAGWTVTSDPAITWGAQMTDINVNFGSQALVNEIMVQRHNLDEEEGEKVYGPYTNAASVADWGKRSATIEVNDSSPLALATNALKVYANPDIFVSSTSFNARDNDYGFHIATRASIYEAVRVTFPEDSIDTTYRLLNMSQTITPDEWSVDLEYRPLEATASVVVTNPPGGANSGPGDLVVPTPGPLGSRTRNTTFSVASGTFTTVPLNNGVTLDQVTWDNTNSRYVVNKDGRWIVAGGVRYNASATGTRGIQLVINGVARAITVEPAGSIGTGPTMTRVFKLAAGDTVALQVYQNSGAALATDGSTGTYLDVAFMGY